MVIANLISGVVVLLLGAFITFFARQLPYEAEYGPGPGFLPFWIGLALIGCSILIIVKAIRKHGSRTGRFFQAKTGQVVFVLGSLIVTFLLLPVLGLSVGLALFTGFTMRTAGRHGWILCFLVALATTVAVRFIFGHLLDIPLPKGYIGL